MPQRAPVIGTVTMNPAIDEAVSIDSLALGRTNRCRLDAVDPGGKGVNASRVIHRLGRATLALGFVGGVTGAFLRAELDREGVPHAFDDVDGFTRINVMVYERSSARRTRLYLPGAPVVVERLVDLKRRLESAPPGCIVLLGGSLPPGLPETTYADLVMWLHARGMRAIIDTSGEALARALAAKPLLIKPSVEEAEELLGYRLTDDAAIVQAAHELHRRGAEHVVISQGADGAIGVGPDTVWKAIPPIVEACSSVGSGDSMVAGLAIAFNEGCTLAYGLRLGTAAGAATAMTPGTRLCEAEEVEALVRRVIVQKLAPTEAQSLGIATGF